MKKSIIAMVMLLALAGCRQSGQEYSAQHEDKEAKEMLQGVWMLDDGEAALLVEGDSVFYPDTACMPQKFWIYKDSLYLQGGNVNRYKIIKQAPHLFKINNPNGDEVRYEKGEKDKATVALFHQSHPYAMNTFDKFSSDTIVSNDLGFFNCRVHVETGSDRVIKSSFNDQGLEVDNQYLDNVARIDILSQGRELVFSHDFRKGEFEGNVPKQMLQNSILRGIQFSHVEPKAFCFDASIGIPDASTTFVVEIRIDGKGNITKKVK